VCQQTEGQGNRETFKQRSDKIADAQEMENGRDSSHQNRAGVLSPSSIPGSSSSRAQEGVSVDSDLSADPLPPRIEKCVVLNDRQPHEGRGEGEGGGLDCSRENQSRPSDGGSSGIASSSDRNLVSGSGFLTDGIHGKKDLIGYSICTAPGEWTSALVFTIAIIMCAVSKSQEAADASGAETRTAALTFFVICLMSELTLFLLHSGVGIISIRMRWQINLIVRITFVVALNIEMCGNYFETTECSFITPPALLRTCFGMMPLMMPALYFLPMILAVPFPFLLALSFVYPLAVVVMSRLQTAVTGVNGQPPGYLVVYPIYACEIAAIFAVISFWRERASYQRFLGAAMLTELELGFRHQQGQVEETLKEICESEKLRLLLAGEVIIDDSTHCTILLATVNNPVVRRQARSPASAISLLDVVYRNFETIRVQLGLQKVLLKGDSYICAVGLMVNSMNCIPGEDPSALVMFAFHLHDVTLRLKRKSFQHQKEPLLLRTGFGEGPCQGAMIPGSVVSYILQGPALADASKQVILTPPSRLYVAATILKRCEGLNIDSVPVGPVAKEGGQGVAVTTTPVTPSLLSITKIQWRNRVSEEAADRRSVGVAMDGSGPESLDQGNAAPEEFALASQRRAHRMIGRQRHVEQDVFDDDLIPTYVASPRREPREVIANQVVNPMEFRLAFGRQLEFGEGEEDRGDGNFNEERRNSRPGQPQREISHDSYATTSRHVQGSSGDEASHSSSSMVVPTPTYVPLKQLFAFWHDAAYLSFVRTAVKSRRLMSVALWICITFCQLSVALPQMSTTVGAAICLALAFFVPLLYWVPFDEIIVASVLAFLETVILFGVSVFSKPSLLNRNLDRLHLEILLFVLTGTDGVPLWISGFLTLALWLTQTGLMFSRVGGFLEARPLAWQVLTLPLYAVLLISSAMTTHRVFLDATERQRLKEEAENQQLRYEQVLKMLLPQYIVPLVAKKQESALYSGIPQMRGAWGQTIMPSWARTTDAVVDSLPDIALLHVRFPVLRFQELVRLCRRVDQQLESLTEWDEPKLIRMEGDQVLLGGPLQRPTVVLETMPATSQMAGVALGRIFQEKVTTRTSVSLVAVLGKLLRLAPITAVLHRGDGLAVVFGSQRPTFSIEGCVMESSSLLLSATPEASAVMSSKFYGSLPTEELNAATEAANLRLSKTSMRWRVQHLGYLAVRSISADPTSEIGETCITTNLTARLPQIPTSSSESSRSEANDKT
jgi:hypothetical protein